MSFWKKMKEILLGPDETNHIMRSDRNISNNKPRIDKMMDLGQVLPVENILINPNISSRDEVLKCIALFLGKKDSKLNSETIFNALLARENVCSTALGSGISLPHAKDKSITNYAMLVVKLDKFISWDEKNKVNIIIVFLSPDPEKDYEHISYLSTISRVLMKNGIIDKLNKVNSQKEIMALFI